MRKDNRRVIPPINNAALKFRQILLIQDENNLGIWEPRKALNEARKQGLDLYIVNENTEPPVCKILDYGKFLYDKKKSEKTKTKPKEVKELRFSPLTQTNDIQTLIKKATDFLTEGHKVKICCVFKGRMLVNKSLKEQVVHSIDSILHSLPCAVDIPLNIEGKFMFVTIKPQNGENKKEND